MLIAFKFCLQYTRKAEFRKLCDNLRMHLSQIQRHHNQSTAINLNNPESQSMHLETRLVQLDSAISMELWQVCCELFWLFFVVIITHITFFSLNEYLPLGISWLISVAR